MSEAQRPLLIVSNRLPVSLELRGDAVEARPSSGGLASALAGFQAEGGFAWVGWPGCVVPDAQRPAVERSLAERQLVPVFLDEQEQELYYRGLCNEALWPLLHYFTDRVAFTNEAWQAYVRVNERFAAACLERCEPGTRVWVHDFHLMLVPRLLRQARPDLEIGFFLHIPFPSSEIYRLLPAREWLLHGLLGADYISFHTNDYARHFRSACMRVLGLESDPQMIVYEGRRVGIGSNPIGIDVGSFQSNLQDPKTEELYHDLEQRYGDRKIVLGVERLDYSKGIPRKLRAFERFLERDPGRAKNVTLLQVLVPSRTSHPEYQELKREIDEQVGQINGRYGGPGWTPVEYLYRSLSPQQLTALYRFADVGLVTPLRDGMNLVAQEFVLCQHEPAPMPADKGLLVLSELAGAAHSLSRALLVNPWDSEQTADAIEAALAIGPEERRERNTEMAERVHAMECGLWARQFLAQLGELATYRRAATRAPDLGDEDAARLRARWASAAHRVTVLDYDGTLREIARSPELAAPTDEIRDLLAALAALSDTEVHLVSGRKRETLESWFGDLPICLCAEHGFVARSPGGSWEQLLEVDLSWLPIVETTLRQVVKEVPGSLVERKTCSLAWHYRMADLDYGEWRARDLLASLGETLANQPVEVISGHRVVEVRASGVNKGRYVRGLGLENRADTFVLCAGDDRTDLDMYRALPSDAITIHVGGTIADTSYGVSSPPALRAMLRSLITDCTAGQPAS